jgi:hypothetical protein
VLAEFFLEADFQIRRKELRMEMKRSEVLTLVKGGKERERERKRK